MLHNKTRQGYARKRTLKPAGYFFLGIERMKRAYTKAPKSYQDQVTLLRERGMEISDADHAAFYLRHINYYRLCAYWLPFEADHATHRFIEGTTFAEVLKLYIFDRELRLLVLDAIERVEVSVRAQWAHQLALHYGSHAHLDEGLARDPKWWERLVQNLNDEVEKSDEVFIRHLRETYEEGPPVWAVCEIMSLGTFSKWYKNLKPAPVRRAIAMAYSLDDELLESWLHHLTFIRNTCAHHSRLWNRDATITPKRPRTKPLALTDQFESGRRIYNSLVILLHFMDIIAPDHSWRSRLKEQLGGVGRDLNAMGFPADWADRSIWTKGS